MSINTLKNYINYCNNKNIVPTWEGLKQFKSEVKTC